MVFCGEKGIRSPFPLFFFFLGANEFACPVYAQNIFLPEGMENGANADVFLLDIAKIGFISNFSLFLGSKIYRA